MATARFVLSLPSIRTRIHELTNDATADARALRSLKTIFEAELKSSVSRIRRGICRPPWVPRDRHLPGVISGAENVIAAGVDGSFFQLTVLSQPALRLLRFVQDLHRGNTPMAAVDEMLDELDPRKAHVDGDALAPVVERGAGWLKEAVERAEQRSFGGEMFGQLAREVLQLPDNSVDVCEAVMRWVDGLVNDAVL
jgi:hypothetical protein